MLRRSRGRGFSLLELIAVMLVLGMLLAVAVPRLDHGRGVQELGYSEQVLTALRIAQRRAQADGCDIRVTISASDFQIEQRATLCSGPFNRDVAGTAAAGSTLGAAAPAGMPLSAIPGVFYFNSDGAAVDSVGGSPVDVSIIVGLRQIQVVGTTGYASF
ncbi:MAG: pilus assembly FimT family protein [Woeseiaceae bacterium]